MLTRNGRESMMEVKLVDGPQWAYGRRGLV